MNFYLETDSHFVFFSKGNGQTKAWKINYSYKMWGRVGIIFTIVGKKRFGMISQFSCYNNLTTPNESFSPTPYPLGLAWPTLNVEFRWPLDFPAKTLNMENTLCRNNFCFVSIMHVLIVDGGSSSNFYFFFRYNNNTNTHRDCHRTFIATEQKIL